jgi:hypothetical protein
VMVTRSTTFLFLSLYQSITLGIAGMPAETCWWAFCE